jgi:xanthine dehydrogenase YagS FAD-binding subunit
LKIRDRDSYEFALTSAAVAMDIDGDLIRDARVAVGGVGTKPWNLPAVCEALKGKRLSRENITAAADLAGAEAKPLRDNRYKIDLVQRTIARALVNLGGLV